MVVGVTGVILVIVTSHVMVESNTPLDTVIILLLQMVVQTVSEQIPWDKNVIRNLAQVIYNAMFGSLASYV